MGEISGWRARLTAGPLDGATIDLDAGQDEPPRAMVISLAVGEDPLDIVWHRYTLDRTTATFRYLGEVDPPGIDASDDRPTPGEPVIDGGELTRRFYELLFELHPAVRSLFTQDMAHQSAVLHTAMRAVLHHLDDPDWLVSTLGALGAQHADWGVTAPMYDAFVDCMVAAMAEAAGDDWSAEVEAGWRGTLGDIGALMQAGASAAR